MVFPDRKLINLIPTSKLNTFLVQCEQRFGNGGYEDHGAHITDIEEAFYTVQRFDYAVPFTGGERDFELIRDELEFGMGLEPRYPEATNDNLQLDLFADLA